MQYVREATAYSAQTPQEVLDATREDRRGRKLREMKLAMALEKKLTKQQILEKYLNISPYGHGGLRHLRGPRTSTSARTPRTSTLAESALIAGLVKAPSTNDPATADGAAEGDRPAGVRARPDGHAR